MKNINLALHSLLKKGENNFIKIFSLSIGLSISLVMLSKVYFETTYDKYHPDSERIYSLVSNYEMDGKYEPDDKVSGGVTEGMKEIPKIESSTRLKYFGDYINIQRHDDKIDVKAIYADTCLFDIFPRKIISGNAKQTLINKKYVMVSKTIASKLGNDVLGKRIYMGEKQNEFIINAVFEDVPKNSQIQYDIIISINNMKQEKFDVTMNWDGGALFYGYVKLYPNVHPDDLITDMREIQKRHVDINEYIKRGYDQYYSLQLLTKVHIENQKKMMILLSTIALAILFTALMNYVLILFSSLLKRKKSLAIHKSLGAKNTDIFKLIYAETSLHLLISLIVAFIIILMFKTQVEENLGVKLISLVSVGNCMFIVAICTLASIIISSIPYFSVKNAAIITSIKQNTNNKSKLLLALQVIGTTFLVVFLMMVSKQYNMFLTEDPGYQYKDLYYVSINNLSKEKKEILQNEIEKLPEVKSVSQIATLPYDYPGGNIVFDENKEVLFYIADLEYSDEKYLPLMGVPIMKGENFSSESVNGDILVSELFAERLVTTAKLTDGLIGKTILISGNGHCRIIGIYKNFTIGASNYIESRPTMISYGKNKGKYLNVKLNNPNQKSIDAVNKKLGEIQGYKRNLESYSEQIYKLYSNFRSFRKSLTQGGLIALLITIIGLIGYTNNNILRRKKDIAIHKVTGAKNIDIIKTFILEISTIAIPSIIIGIVFAYLANNKWTEDFSNKANFSILLTAVAFVVIMLILNIITFVNCIKISKQNPVESLKAE